MGALDHLKQGVNIDKPKTEEDLVKDKEYDAKEESATKEKTEEMKNKAFSDLYLSGKIQMDETSNEVSASIDKVNNESEKSIMHPDPGAPIEHKETMSDFIEGKNDNVEGFKGIPENNEPVVDSLYSQPLKENKYFPMIKRLYESKQISTESFENIQNEIYTNNGNFDINNIKIDIAEKNLVEGLMTNLESDNIEQNILDFGKDIKDIEEFSDLNLDLSIDGKFESNVLNDIGKNYIKIPDGGKNINIKADISTAIETTRAKILKNVKNIAKDSQTYKTAMVNIDSGNLKQQLEGITTLSTLAYSGEGKLAKKEVNKYTVGRKEEIKEKAVILTQKIKKAEKLNDQKVLDELSIEKALLISEANEIESGDVFESGENDKVGENDPLGNLEQA